MTVKTTPEWALNLGDPVCKLPKDEYLEDFYKFVRELDKRYHPEYIEIWNEPDMPYALPNLFGCIDDGAEYGDFVAKTYQNITQDIDAKILMGATASLSNGFIDDALREVQDNYDALSFHCYAPLYSELVNTCAETLEIAKEITHKEVILSETAVLYKSGTKEQLESAQIEYYNWLLSAKVPFYWYTINWNGWPICDWICNTDMVYKNKMGEIIPRPVWYKYYE